MTTLTYHDYPAGSMDGSAVLSDCGRYRYELGRRWAPAGESAIFVMLNPSTADAFLDDPTIRRCVGFSRSWGCHALKVVNLYALRSADPKALWTASDPIGPSNDNHLRDCGASSIREDHLLIAAWGANAKHERVAQVMNMWGFKQTIRCLGVTKGGAPKHPLYLPAHTELQRWST